MHLPELDGHLRRLGVSWDMFTSKLVLTLCSSYVPLELLGYIYDVFFLDGWTGLYKIIIAFMGMQQANLLGKDLCAVSEYLRRLKGTIKLQDIRRILRRAVDIHIRRDAIEKGIDDFFISEAERLLSTGKNWPREHRQLLEQSVARIAAHQAQQQRDVTHIQSKLSAVELQLVK